MRMRLLAALVTAVVVLAGLWTARERARHIRIGGSRPAELLLPRGLDRLKPAPVLMVLHPYGGQADGRLGHQDFRAAANRMGALLIIPAGSPDRHGAFFWNATDACCDLDRAGVDDVKYLAGLVEETALLQNVDRARIYVAGHSNGGFMALRLACDRPDLFAAVVGVAGATWLDPARCQPRSPVSVLQVHGDHDEVVRYPETGATPNPLLRVPYPGAVGTVTRWMNNDHCAGPLANVPGLFDFEARLAGSDTRLQHAEGCPRGVDVELWTIQNGPHDVHLTEAFVDAAADWLTAHPKVSP